MRAPGQIMHTYSDLVLVNALVNDKVDYTDTVSMYCLYVEVDKESGIPLMGSGDHEFGLNAALIQSEKKLTSYHNLNERLKELEYARVRMDILLEQFDGLDYKVAYKRIVEFKTHQEIADEL